jgi:hypothetical protein
VLVADLPSTNNSACTLDTRCEIEQAQHSQTVGVDQKAGSQSVPGWLAFHELRREAVPMKRCCRGETGYTAANDQDSSDVGHILSIRDGILFPRR